MYCSNCGSPAEGSPCLVCGDTGRATLPHHPETTAQLTGWWRRVAATLVDDLILLIPTLVVAAIVRTVAGVFVASLAAVAVEGVYMVKLLSAPAGQTFGNRAVHSRVCDALTGRPLSRQQALRRWGFVAVYGLIGVIGAFALGFLAAVIGLVDVLFPLFNARHQTLHDRFAGTIVVKS